MTAAQKVVTAAPSSQWFRPGWPDRLIALFSQVEPGEGAGTLLMGMNIFLLLAAYYLLKTVREALILTQGGAEVKAYSAAGQALLLLGVVPLYSWIARRLTRIWLIALVNGFFALNLVLFCGLDRAGTPVGVPFYLWLGIFNVMIVAQFWAFANDLYSEDAGKRLFPIIGVGSSLGALVGSKVASSTFALLGADLLILASAALLTFSVGLSWIVNSRACSVCARQRANSQRPSGSESGLTIVIGDRYLRLIAAMVVLVNVVNTGGEFLLSKLVVNEAVRAAGGAAAPKAVQQAFIGSFYGDYFTWVGLLGLLLQLFLVSRLFRWVGVRKSLFLLPLVALGGYGLIAAVPALSIAFAAKICENATDYSVENTARQALFLPVRRDAKYQAKTAIDTFFYRLGDMSQAAIVWMGAALALTPRHFAWINIVLVAIWLVVVFRLERTSPSVE